MDLQFELDGQGSLDITSDSAVVTVFEFKSSLAGNSALLLHPLPQTALAWPACPLPKQSLQTVQGCMGSSFVGFIASSSGTCQVCQPCRHDQGQAAAEGAPGDAALGAHAQQRPLPAGRPVPAREGVPLLPKELLGALTSSRLSMHACPPVAHSPTHTPWLSEV